jgi:hypothetical protein
MDGTLVANGGFGTGFGFGLIFVAFAIEFIDLIVYFINGGGFDNNAIAPNTTFAEKTGKT